MPVRIIIHVDMDAFYSSVEQRQSPDLKGKPVIVGADPRGGSGRGVVAGCSYEARRFGVHSAQPISQAFRLCPQGVFLHPNYALYDEVSEQVMQVLRPFATKFEQISIDEAFMDITGAAYSFQEAENLAKEIKQKIREQTQLGCSIGIAPTKSVAKIASDFKKPNGLTIIPPEHVREFLALLPVNKISGVGKKGEEALKQIGVSTIGELSLTDPSKLQDTFGKSGIRLWQIANGIDEEPVVTSYSIKSISAETTFEEDLAEKSKVTDSFQSLIDDVHARLLSQDMLFRTVGIKIRLEDFSTFNREKSSSRFTNDKTLIEDCVKNLFNEFNISTKKFRLLGVRVSNLRKADGEQETILTWTEGQRNLSSSDQ